MRVRWRKLTAKSWVLSQWIYRLHGLTLTGRPSHEVRYFAYGSNMHERVFLERRGMRPMQWRIGQLEGYRLRFNLDGKPKGKSAPANICRDPSAEVWGVLYLIQFKDMLRLDASEGVPGGRYRPYWLDIRDGDGSIVRAMTYMALGNPEDGRPSSRYLSLLQHGARARG